MMIDNIINAGWDDVYGWCSTELIPDKRDCEYKTKMVKDVVHQFVELPSDFFDTAIDTLGIQRLRDIKQLSLAHLVYPGATHNRFEHSLGVAHVMNMAIKSLTNNIREHVVPSLKHFKGDAQLKGLANSLAVFLSRLAEEINNMLPEAITAALYHDSGHIALSHPGEDALRDPLLYYSPDPHITMSELATEGFDHEKLGLALVLSRASCNDKECQRVRFACRDVDLKTVVEVLDRAYNSEAWSRECRPVIFTRRNSGKLIPEYEYEPGSVKRIAKCIIANLLSSPIDVDRADYTLRDSMHTGSRSGIWDINRYYSVLTIVPRITSRLGGEEYRVNLSIGVLDKGVSIVESMLLSRIYMYGDVYLHDISMIYSGMASRALALLYAVSRYMLYDAEKGDEQAGSLLKKYPILDTLAQLPLWARPNIGSDYTVLEERLAYLTDTPVLDIIQRIALGLANDLLSYIKAKAESVSGEARRKWFIEACTSLVLASRGVIKRKHWGSIILADDRAAQIIANLKGSPHEVNVAAKSLLSRNITPLFIISWSSYMPYKGEGKNRIFVFRRRTPLSPVEITKSPDAKIVGKIAGLSYSKFLISVPRIDEEPLVPGWYHRRSKLEQVDYMVAAKLCGCEKGELNQLIHEASLRALRVAGELLELS